ncbi:winged helix-turn-helix transcriptional regulator [Chachezhania antarctica]|uniref:winged helix-turn-helix transcriptional regulator n=1 Tax=Chachezhania antarctica TaxID=2340860 RepID=UPI000EAFC147|nr:winged helix-turn-helix transcriptional regulator [Chachezhania antarctica]
MDIDQLVNITSRAWSLPILASLGAGTPGRQAPLLAATGANRTAFAQSMAHLVALGLVERTPGHGHPLRPEFRLTAAGAGVAVMAQRILSVGEGAELLRRTWTVPVLAVCQRPRHFSQIKRDLGPITDRALSGALKQLHGHRWLQRETDTEQYPPRPLYRAANAGVEIAHAAYLASAYAR